MLVIVAAGLMALQSSPPILDSEEAIRQALATCAIAVDNAEIGYDEMLQDYAVTIRTPSSRLDERQYECIARMSSAGAPFVFFADAVAEQQLGEVRRSIEIEEARAWLAERGLLARLPRYDATNTDLASYGRALEALCGIKPGTSILADETGEFTLVDRAISKINSEQFWCLLNAGAASELNKQHLGIGFRGNEINASPE